MQEILTNVEDGLKHQIINLESEIERTIGAPKTIKLTIPQTRVPVVAQMEQDWFENEEDKISVHSF